MLGAQKMPGILIAASDEGKTLKIFASRTGTVLQRRVSPECADLKFVEVFESMPARLNERR